MLEDAQQAIGLTRAYAESWGCRSLRVGVLGFSAGGHLAATAATACNAPAPERPDFAVLIYPVIRMAGPLSHPGCRAALTGETDETDLARSLDTDRRVAPGCPPAFLVHGGDDEVIAMGNSLAYASACREAKVPCELHVFANGPHGFGLARGAGAVGAWPGLCAGWVRRLVGGDNSA